MNGASEGDAGGYKRRCRALKRRLKLLLYEQECFQEELRRAQRKLLKVSRDKSFLLDRLLQYENVDDDSSDSEATASSDNSDGDGAKGAEPTPAKRSARVPLPHPKPLPLPKPHPLFGKWAWLNLCPLPPRWRRRPTAPSRRRAGLSGGRGPGSPLPPPALAPPPAPPPIPPTLPRRLLSDPGEGEGEGSDDPLDGDDELVIDLPE
ncbi:unnamed protein product [Coccothraustes coccothraustes]